MLKTLIKINKSVSSKLYFLVILLASIGLAQSDATEATVLRDQDNPDSVRAYDRLCRNHECTKFESEERSRRGFNVLLIQLGKKELGTKDQVWLVDLPKRIQLKSGSMIEWQTECGLELDPSQPALIRAHVDSLSGRYIQGDLIQLPEEYMIDEDRKTWRSYLLVFKKVQSDATSIWLESWANELYLLER